MVDVVGVAATRDRAVAAVPRALQRSPRTGFHRDGQTRRLPANFHAWTASSAILHHWMMHEPRLAEAIFPGSWRSCSASAGFRVVQDVTSDRPLPRDPSRSPPRLGLPG
jgi:hypothetical protein